MSALLDETLVRSALEDAQTLSFGPFTLDARTLELRRDGVLVPIAPQPARLLLTLASRAGELVTRDELRQSVWGNDTFVDFERGLNFCVLQARTALGDDAKNPTYIETLPKRGYRFIATIRQPTRASAIGAQPVVIFAILTALALLVWPRNVIDHTTSKVPAAHESYLRGRQLYQQRAPPQVEASVRELRNAIRLEPDFALPYVALAESLHALAMRERIAPRTAAVEIRNASANAVRLAPSYAGSHAITAMQHFWYDWDWDAAEESYQRAIRLDPRNASALHDHGWLLIVRGHFDEGIAEIRRAQELEPANPRANMHVAWAYVYTRRYADAIREAQRALELSPGLEEANACVEAAIAMRANRAFPPAASDGADFYANAVRHVRLGDHDGAISWLTRAKEIRNTSIPLAGVDPKLEPLHRDARFVELLASMGLRPQTR